MLGARRPPAFLPLADCRHRHPIIRRAQGRSQGLLSQTGALPEATQLKAERSPIHVTSCHDGPGDELSARYRADRLTPRFLAIAAIVYLRESCISRAIAVFSGVITGRRPPLRPRARAATGCRIATGAVSRRGGRPGRDG